MTASDFVLPRTSDGAVDVDALRQSVTIDAMNELDLMRVALKLCPKDLPEDGKPIAASLAMLSMLDYMARRLSLTVPALRETLREVLRKSEGRERVHIVHVKPGEIALVEGTPAGRS